MVYLITGATGNVGSLVVAHLMERGERPRVFVRDAEKAQARFGNRVDIFVGDLADTTTLSRALAGVDALFLVNSGHDLAERDGAAAKAAVAAGVKHLVKLSSIDAREQHVGTGVWHAQGEAAIRASGVSFTFVQPSGFMTNALYWASSIKAEGIVRTCTGDGKIPFIHSDDIAEIAVRALTTRDYDGVSLPITGPEALSYAEMTAKIAAVIGKPLVMQPISDAEARQQQLAWAAPEPLVEARLSIFRAIREGRLATPTDTVLRVLGRKPITFDQWVRENAAAFRSVSG
jgi:(4-alkanoyl-5-oxo-2,5-dihydrofuran-3-yl)methyl phosphate reductase